MREEGTPIRNDDNASEKFGALEDSEEEEAATSTVPDAAFGEKGIIVLGLQPFDTTSSPLNNPEPRPGHFCT